MHTFRISGTFAAFGRFVLIPRAGTLSPGTESDLLLPTVALRSRTSLPDDCFDSVSTTLVGNNETVLHATAEMAHDARFTPLVLGARSQ
ncbi:hypothetical protein ACFR97_17205 [Haloplanus litoreus]|uniref:Uncharacterized protein n=1 Tax=Haloplanus litoreus TaxID=767515 RepID=A0ABD5ZX08_9EURY